LLLFILNLGISWLNAWGCGKTWNETKSVGGFPHFMNWMGAIMAAVGFTWCYLVVIGLIGPHIPIEQDDGTTEMLMTMEMQKAFFDLGYIAIIIPCIGSGLAITVHSWGVFWRRRTFADGAVAGYNTFAEVHNIYSAVRHLPGAIDNVGDFFRSDDSSDGKGTIVLILAAVAILGGVLTTYFIIKNTAKSTALSRRYHYEEKFEEIQRQKRAEARV
jgi:hypothetical protein